MSYDYLFKIVLIGNTYVGKTAITERLINDRYTSHIDSTIGVDFATLSVKVRDKIIKTHLWDTAGQETFQSIIRNYYYGIAGALIIFDVCNRKSFQQVNYWYDELIKNTDMKPYITLIGNKIDSPHRVVTTEEAEQYAQKYGFQYVEVSAKTGANVYNAFKTIIQTIYDNMDKTNLRPGIKRHFSHDENNVLFVRSGEYPSNYSLRDGINACCCCF